MTSTKEIEHELIYKGKEYVATLEVTAELIDESFDHAFGTESASGVEVIDLEITNLYSIQRDKDLIGKRLIRNIEKEIDEQEFADQFDFDEFEIDYPEY